MYEMGDVVKIWSLQSFFHGGFLKGQIGIVFQDQHSEDGSVLVSVLRNIGGDQMIDSSYEIYNQQVQLVQKTDETRKENVKWFKNLLSELRIYEHEQEMKGIEEQYTPYAYAPEFFIDENYFFQLDDKKLRFPEFFI